MKFQSKPDMDKCCVKVFSDAFRYSRSVSDKDISSALGELQDSIKCHVDDISSIDNEYAYLYSLEEDGNEYETLYEALVGELSTELYGYYHCKYIDGRGNNCSEYADDFKELCEIAYRHPTEFKLYETGTDKLTTEQQDLINKIVEFSLK